jgi:N-acetylglucosamine-6-phosphate deacetylase
MNPGKYQFMGSDVVLMENGLVYNTELNCLAGASYPLKKGVENIMNFIGCSLTNAVNIASRNVARILGLNDRGRLESGARADLILFELNANTINIKRTWIKGKLVFCND